MAEAAWQQPVKPRALSWCSVSAPPGPLARPLSATKRRHSSSRPNARPSAGGGPETQPSLASEPLPRVLRSSRAVRRGAKHGAAQPCAGHMPAAFTPPEVGAAPTLSLRLGSGWAQAAAPLRRGYRNGVGGDGGGGSRGACRASSTRTGVPRLGGQRRTQERELRLRRLQQRRAQAEAEAVRPKLPWNAPYATNRPAAVLKHARPVP